MTPASVSAVAVPRNRGPVSNGASPATSNPWPELDPKVLYGLVGDVVETLRPETEADPAALAMTFLVAYGSAVGSGRHALVGGPTHPARLFAVIVGETSKARKGTSLSEIRRVMRKADEEWTAHRHTGGLSTGEGLIAKLNGGHDKRLMMSETEFARVLTVAARDGNTLSAVIRQAWDDGDLSVATKELVIAQGAHLSILGHVTLEEMVTKVTSLEVANGFANRFLFVCVKPGPLLPSGGKFDDQTVNDLGLKVKQRIEEGRDRRISPTE